MGPNAPSPQAENGRMPSKKVRLPTAKRGLCPDAMPLPGGEAGAVDDAAVDDGAVDDNEVDAVAVAPSRQLVLSSTVFVAHC